MALLTIPFVGAAGNNVGSGSDGVFGGFITASALAKFIRQRRYSSTGYCYTDDGGVFVDKSTDWNDAGANDVQPLPNTPAVDDAFYIGEASIKFGRVDITIGTQGDWVGTGTWKYRKSDNTWAALSNVVDGTAGFTAAAGTVSLTFDIPTDWIQNTVDSLIGYWIGYFVTAHTSITTPPAITQGFVITPTESVREDDTTDLNDADAGDVDVFSGYPLVGDAAYFQYASKFCALKATVATARTGTATLAWKYWNGLTYSTLTVNDDSVAFSAGTSTYLVHFKPPADWVANTAENGPNGQAGFTISLVITAFTSMAAKPVLTRAWVLPISGSPVEGVTGLSGTITNIEGFAKTVSGTNNDSKFLIINKTTGLFAEFTWTKGVARVSQAISLAVAAADQVVIRQWQEDGTDEFTDGFFTLTYG